MSARKRRIYNIEHGRWNSVIHYDDSTSWPWRWYDTLLRKWCVLIGTKQPPTVVDKLMTLTRRNGWMYVGDRDIDQYKQTIEVITSPDFVAAVTWCGVPVEFAVTALGDGSRLPLRPRETVVGVVMVNPSAEEE